MKRRIYKWVYPKNGLFAQMNMSIQPVDSTISSAVIYGGPQMHKDKAPSGVLSAKMLDREAPVLMTLKISSLCVLKK
jgi:hypothetical protein